MPVFGLPEKQQPQLTEPEKQVQMAQKLTSLGNATFASLAKNIEVGLLGVWQCPLGLSPQKVLDGLGSNAAEFVNATRDLIQVVNKYVPGAIDTSQIPAVTVNEDGTVTVQE